jgi:2-polyprenyl-3-methyl-5-hydroxy-6-metoxy-1,4-benzoquinol methylase
VEIGRRRRGVDLRQGSVETVDEPPGSADAVAAFDVLEHVVDPLEALRRLRSIVDDDGILVLSTAAASGERAGGQDAAGSTSTVPRLHVFTPRTLTWMLKRAGFRPVEWTPVPRTMFLPPSAEGTLVVARPE